MAKKEFKRVNPSEAFITISEEAIDEQEGKMNKAEKNPEDVLDVEKAVEIVKTPIEEPVQEIEKESVPVERIITPTIIPDGGKRNPKFIETKSRKVQLLLQPSVVESIKAFARQNGISMNEAINQAIQEYVVRHM